MSSRVSDEPPIRLLVALPCLNEAQTIADVIAAIPGKLEGIDAISVLVVDDGSSDNTVAIAKNAGAAVISHTYNKGVGAAFKSAVDYAVENRFTLMVNIDGDNQFNPADIRLLVAPILSGEADMVTASRFIDPAVIPDMPKVKLWGNHMMSKLVSFLTRKSFHDVSCGFRCYGRESLLNLNLHGMFTYTQETFLDLISKQLRIVEVPVAVRYFADRKSRVAGSIVKYTISTSKIILRGYRDYFPLRFFWGIAVGCCIPALLSGLVFFQHFFATGKFSGYLFCGFLAAFFTTLSIIFFVVGLMADMLVRIRTNQERILYRLKKDGNGYLHKGSE